MSETRAEATRRIQRAMALVERAQNELDWAMQNLSPVTHWAPEYRAVGVLRERVHKLWWRLEQKLRRGGKYDLDESGRAALLRDLSENPRVLESATTEDRT